MAQYKYDKYLTKVDGAAYDEIFTPGTISVNSGIYRCEGCGDEIAANKGNPLPPQNHHQHTTAQGAIRWKLIVFSASKG